MLFWLTGVLVRFSKPTKTVALRRYSLRHYRFTINHTVVNCSIFSTKNVTGRIHKRDQLTRENRDEPFNELLENCFETALTALWA